MARADDPFLEELVRRRHESPCQQRLRLLAPLPFAVGYRAPRGRSAVQAAPEYLERLRQDFRRIRVLGYTALRSLDLPAGLDSASVRSVALDENLIPWFFGDAGWEPVTPELLEQLGIGAGLTRPELQEHLRVVDHQMSRLRDLEEATVETALAFGDCSYPLPVTVTDLGALQVHLRARVARAMESVVGPLRQRHGGPPILGGGHSAFENQALSGFDREAEATLCAPVGCYSARLSPSELPPAVRQDLDVAAYLTARMARDMFKGGWSGVWDLDAGPSPFHQSDGQAVGDRLVPRLALAMIAAGSCGIGLRDWLPRESGALLGSGGLTDLQGRPTARAEACGLLSRACQKHRFELWESVDHPRVGILVSWENEAACAGLGILAGTAGLAEAPVLARFGIARALSHLHVPWEFVTESDLEAGLAARYGTIYLPHTLAVRDGTLNHLRRYVESGGHLVADAPGLLVDGEGCLLSTAISSDFERIFGCELAEVQPAGSAAPRVGGRPVTGSVLNVAMTSARVVQTFDESDRPAVVEYRAGMGRGTLLTFEASGMAACDLGGELDQLLRRCCLGDDDIPFSADQPVLIYRRIAPRCDHYFILNPGEAASVTLQTHDRLYISGEDCVSGDRVRVWGNRARFDMVSGGGRWIRLHKFNE